jgi:hypothetical protein
VVTGFILLDRIKASAGDRLLVLENGIFIFGMLLVDAMPFLVEIGVLLDVFVGIFVVSIIIHHIHREFASLDTRHLASLNDADDALLLGRLLAAARRAAADAGLEQYRLVINTGADAGQSVRTCLVLAGASWPGRRADGGEMQITWLGHSALKIEGSRIVFVDPFLSGNPKASLRAEDIDRADVVAVSHDHGDHLGDSFAICRRTGAAGGPARSAGRPEHQSAEAWASAALCAWPASTFRWFRLFTAPGWAGRRPGSSSPWTAKPCTMPETRG